ncbi:MAG TPA: hypothetical protein GXZ90_10060 [Clostridiales bacterium]|nr:hypothetical protein [Clostridiales bacterium]
MINFDEELKKYQPSLDVDEAEEAIYNNDLTDLSDIMKELIKEKKQTNTVNEDK